MTRSSHPRRSSLRLPARGPSSRAATGWWRPRRARGRTAQSSCARLLGLEDVISLGLAAPTHDERSWTFDLDPGGRDPVLGIERLQEAYLRRDPTTTRGSRCPALVDDRQRRGGHQRLPVPHPRPLLRVARAPPTGCAGPVARGRARGDGRGDGAGLHRGEQRRLPVRLRRLAGGVRRGLRPPLDHPRLARGPAHRPPLPDGRARSPRPTYGSSRRSPASTRSTTGTSSATGKKLTELPALWGYARDLFQTPGFGDTIDFDQIKRHYYVVQSDVNPSGIVPRGPDTSGWIAPHGREGL